MSDMEHDLSDFDLDDLIGQLVNGIYLLEDKIGEGGMGAVFRAMHLRTQQLFAIKVIAPHLVANRNDARRFLREARVGLMLSHPSIVKVHEFGETPEGLLFMVMDYAEGVLLSDVIEDQSPLSPVHALNILNPLCEALDYAHRRNILHRDLKPSNIIITKDSAGNDTAKLLDFGIMKLLQPDEQISFAPLTDVNVIIGTPDYMSPEQLMNHELKSTSDIYSAGIILYQMLTSQVPIEYFDFSDFLMNKVYRDADPPSTKMPHVPPAIDQVLMKALARDPEQRHQNAGDLYREFLRAVYSLPSHLQQPDAAAIAEWQKYNRFKKDKPAT